MECLGVGHFPMHWNQMLSRLNLRTVRTSGRQRTPEIMHDAYYHIVYINVAQRRAMQGDPLVAEFVDNVERVNAVASMVSR